ncbi:MAG: DUF3570 domain-containing protein [Luteolibacter sp.]|uniref:DUF3570 domain-containing protein n=1 Tax=Luteolibacter sp. TaxID=1962973 RepID=UPI0032646846
MSPRHPLFLASIIGPAVQTQAEIMPQTYDYGYQLYQEDSDRIKVESHYVRGEIDINDATSFRFQWLNDAISGASPTGALPGSSQPYLSDVEDVRTGILGAISRQFGDHRVELEISKSTEDDYDSRGYALSDKLELNQKNTTLSYGINYLDDSVKVPGLGNHEKNGYDLFTGVSQIIDKDTIISANLTLGYNDGYLNDPYKVVQRNEIVTIPDGLGGTIDVPVVNIYRENRPDHRFRQVLQLEGTRYFEPADGALDVVVRLSNDDYGIFSETLQVEWRQVVAGHLMLTPFFRIYHQNAADFFVNTLNGLPIGTPAADPNGSGINYSADYRLSAFNAFSGGLKISYQFNEIFSASAAYERYVMSATGGTSDHSPEQSYPSANIWTVGVNAEF